MENRRFVFRSVDVSLMNPAPYNPRVELTPMDREWRSIENSLDSFGYIEPIVWNERTGNIVGGHMRYRILKERGRLPKEIGCIVVDLSEDTYEEPDNPRTTCPHCGFTDESRHFRKTSKPDGGGS